VIAVAMRCVIIIIIGLIAGTEASSSHGAEARKPTGQSEWERTVQTAKKQGALALYLFQGEGELSGRTGLAKKNPEIKVVATTGRGNTLGPRIMAERRAGIEMTPIYDVVDKALANAKKK
jgi:hypothetical protein